VTLDRARKSSAFEDRFHCQKSRHRFEKKTFPPSFCRGSTLLATISTEINVKDRQLRSLNVQVDLFSVVKVLTRDETDQQRRRV